MGARRQACVVVGAVVAVAVAVLALLMLVALIRAAMLEEVKYPELESVEGEREELPSWYLDGLPELFAAALAIPTVSTSPGQYETEHLLRFHQFLREGFPNVFNNSYIKVEVVNTYSLLFTISGSNKELMPYMLTGHIDVVPVVKEKWTHDPWGGLIIPDPDTGEHYIWGRGAIDNKLGVMGIMMALQYLAQTDFQPSRSFFVAFGHDEEVFGTDGAGHIAQLLKERGVKLDFLLDEGLPVLKDIIMGITAPVAMVGVTEKGRMTVKLEVEGEGGHSSMPPMDPAVTRLAAALYNLDRYQQPSMFGQGPEIDLFTYLAPKASWPHKLIYANMWLFKPLVAMVMSRKRDTNAVVRTTTSATLVRAGVKENVVPASASAIINHRVHPAQSLEHVIQHDINVINDPTVKLTVQSQMEAHPVSPYGQDVPGWRLLSSAIHHHFPDAIVAPGILMANTDSVHYLDLTAGVYRFYPLLLKEEDLAGIHGAQERLSVPNLLRAVRFYHRVMVLAPWEEVVPPPSGVLVGNTDTLFYLDLTPCVYRFVPIQLLGSDVRMVHGHDERASSGGVLRAAEFYHHVILAGDVQHLRKARASSRADGEL